VQYVFTRGPAGITGTATYKDETVVLQNISCASHTGTADTDADTDTDTANGGARVTWRRAVRKPMRLNLNFDVVLDGDVMTGHSRAGKLPRPAVTGRLRQASPKTQAG
jgi:hypothetical protein